MKKSKTKRGFALFEGTDLYGSKYSLQKSSLATQDAIWLGIDDADPKIMCSDARKLGLREWKENMEENNGWCKFDIPKEVLLDTRMHLNRKQAKELIAKLQVFVDTGEL